MSEGLKQQAAMYRTAVNDNCWRGAPYDCPAVKLVSLKIRRSFWQRVLRFFGIKSATVHVVAVYEKL